MFRKKWNPNKSQRREFAEKMKDPEFAKAYYERREKRAEKRRSTSSFDYESAGGEYIPTKTQYEYALKLLSAKPSKEEVEACNYVIHGYNYQEKIHHDYIHIVNEYIRLCSSKERENGISF